MNNKFIPKKRIRVQSYERYLPTAFDESLSILEKINKVIHYLHQYSEITEEMLIKWDEVYEWVQNEGLQSTVGDKLNEWLTDGVIEEIINEEIFGDLNNQITDLKTEINDLTEFLEEEIINFKNDMNNEFTDFSNETNDKIIAIDNKKINSDTYYDEIKISQHKDEITGTTYYLSYVPKLDKNGEIIKLKRGYSNETYSPDPYVNPLKTPREMAVDHKATLGFNSSSFSASHSRVLGIEIYDGVVLQNFPRRDFDYTLAIGDDNFLRSYPPTTDPQQILNDGYRFASHCFIPLIQNSVPVSDSVIENVSTDIFVERHPRQIIAQNHQGDIYIFTSSGRRFGEMGLTAKDCIRILMNLNIRFAQMLDGGGSAQTIYYDTLINKISDGEGTTERLMPAIHYFGKDDENTIQQVLNPIGEINKVFNDRMANLEEGLTYRIENYISLNPYLINGWESYSSVGANHCRAWIMPNNTMYFVGTLRQPISENRNLPCMQLPPQFKPIFSTQHLTAGNTRGEIYKITISSSGEMVVRYWSDVAFENRDLDYVKLDGIFIVLDPRREF